MSHDLQTLDHLADNITRSCALSALGVWLITKEPTSHSDDHKRPSSDDSILPKSVSQSGASIPKLAINTPSTRARKLSLTLGGTQYVLAHSPRAASKHPGLSTPASGSSSDNEDAEERDMNGDSTARDGTNDDEWTVSGRQGTR